MRFILFFFILLPVIASSQEIRVQSGDHRGYTRLAILFESMPDWSLGRVPGGYELRTSAEGTEYNIDSVFRRIGRNRIGSVRPLNEGDLFISVECDCYANAFEFSEALVIDIIQGGPPADAKFEQPPVNLRNLWSTSETFDGRKATEENSDILDSFNLASDGYKYAYWSDTLLGDELFYEFEASDLDLEVSDLPSSTNLEPENAPTATSQQTERIIEDFIRAAEKGFVNIIESADDLLSKEGSSDGLDFSQIESHLASDFLGENIELDAQRSSALNSEGEYCIEDSVFDFLGAEIGKDPLEHVSRYRKLLFNEAGALDESSLANIVRSYLFLSFGAEARLLMSAFDIDFPNREVYWAMSEVIDEGRTLSPGPFTNQMDCVGKVALWAVLARGSLRASDEIEEKSVMAAFSELPLHFRRQLGPELVERFLKIDDLNTAEAIRNSLARAPGYTGEELGLIDAEVALSAGEVQESKSILEEIVLGNQTLASSALIRLIDTSIDHGLPIDKKFLENAAALAFANSGTELGMDLNRVYVRALTDIGFFESALAELESGVFDQFPEVEEDLKIEVFDRISLEALPDRFLKLVVPGPVILRLDDGGDVVRRRIANRLIQLGLTETARNQVFRGDLQLDVEDRVLLARSYLKEKRPYKAIEYLVEVQTPESRRLMAEAYELAAEYEKAQREYAEVDDTMAVARTAWRSQNWDAAAKSTSGIKREAATIASERLPETSGASSSQNLGDGGALENAIGLGDIGKGQLIVEESKQARRIIDELLSLP